MKITLLVVGRTVDNNIIAGINEYTQRLGRFAQFDTVVIPELKNAKKLSEAQQKELEGDAILAAMAPGDRVVLLDEGGQGVPFYGVCGMDRAQTEYFDQAVAVCCRWPIRLCA